MAEEEGEVARGGEAGRGEGGWRVLRLQPPVCCGLLLVLLFMSWQLSGHLGGVRGDTDEGTDAATGRTSAGLDGWPCRERLVVRSLLPGMFGYVVD